MDREPWQPEPQRRTAGPAAAAVENFGQATYEEQQYSREAEAAAVGNSAYSAYALAAPQPPPRSYTPDYGFGNAAIGYAAAQAPAPRTPVAEEEVAPEETEPTDSKAELASGKPKAPSLGIPGAESPEEAKAKDAAETEALAEEESAPAGVSKDKGKPARAEAKAEAVPESKAAGGAPEGAALSAAPVKIGRAHV